MAVSPTRAHTRYRNSKQQIVPGVTTVIALLAKPALINWAWKQGMAGEDINKVKELAANIGTCAHYLIECFLVEQEPDLEHFTVYTAKEAQKLFKAFTRWHKHQGVIETLGCEVELVSEEWQFGGCIDWVARLHEKVTLLDIKTSKGIYDEYRIQLAAYKQMWDEMHPDTPIEEVIVLHLDKETYDLTPHPFSDLAKEWEVFKHLRAIYMLQKAPSSRKDTRKSGRYNRIAKDGRVRT